MACGTDSVSNVFGSNSVTGQFVACELCNELEAATSHCDDCLVNLCDSCASSHRKRREPKERHHLEPGVCNYNMEIELCPEDGQKMSFFCPSCRVRVCPECELTRKRHVMHEVVPLDQHLGREKEKLLERLDDVTAKIGTVNYLPEDIKAMAIQIELKWLERKEMMRQEFTSLLESITTRQQNLMAEMEEEVKQSLQKLEELQHAHETLLSSSCQLSDDCILAVQNLPREDFLESYDQFLESAKDLEGQVEKMKSPADCMPAFLQMPFSLHHEKVQLDSRLQLHTYGCQYLKAREYLCFIPFDCLMNEMTVDMLVDTPQPLKDVPTSSFLRYQVKIYQGGRKNKLNRVWKNWRSLKSTDAVLNGYLGFKLAPRSLYTLKVRPVITVVTHQGHKTMKGRYSSIVIVTEGPRPENSSGASLVASDGQVNLNNNALRMRSATLFKNKHRKHQQSSSSDHQINHIFHPVIHIPFLHFENLSSSPYECDIGQSETDRQHPVPARFPEKGKLQVQSRYALNLCSFEEARLIEGSQSKP